MTVAEIQAQIRAMIARLARVDDAFSADADVFREIGLQSAAALDLLLQIEEEFSVEIADDAFAKTRTLDQMTTMVAELRGHAA